MTTAAASIAPPPRARSPWFHSARFDLLLILCVPFLTWPLVMAAQGAVGPTQLNQLILLTATGHYLATFVRAYGDRELFARWKTRFVLVPLVLLVTCVSMFASGHTGALLLVTAAWAFWHWLAQAFGFARIYDIKVGSFRPLTALLDKALVIVGFVSAVTLNDGSVATFGKVFLDAGIALPGAAQFAVIQTAVLGAVVLVGTAYVANLVWTIAHRQPWSWQKQFMHATTIGYYWFAFAWVPNVLVAYVLYELFHDIQYYAITWLTCRQRVRRPGVAPWLGRMFRPGFGAALGFVLVMTAFGAVDFVGRLLPPEESLHQVWLDVFLTVALLHYYYDGFIWKARESSLGNDLGIQGGLRATVAPGLRHAASWLLFFAPLVSIMVLGGDRFTPRQRAAALVAIAPGDFLSQAELGFELFRSRELPAALDAYRASIASNPDYAQARANFGNALDFTGDLNGAREQFEQALRCHDDKGTAHPQAHINLGVLLLLAGDRTAALQHFEAGRLLRGIDPIERMLGLASAGPSDAVERRLKLYAAVLQLDRNQIDAHMNLGHLLLARGQFETAASHFTAALQQSADLVPALIGLCVAQAERGQFEPARATLQQALQRDPGNAQALELKARLVGR